ncbi:hypothetical protein CQW49_12585 [Methylosinus trichosporium OB3b]|uniref:Porin n=1 Tax=Methylosinus trichosporium (strain ATCC 35070 / NCIMB 11131 / UNIQEM 75 / OB3b) TaxID=595536 RepID=A0A2D2D0V8_METT3|nr:outer membrane beta-barrel protein [Methylosinus trichosporium]ATQ68626.1 hypothetical protein CQW49_12585 [Methylosinus trichosporium OB3b]
MKLTLLTGVAAAALLANVAYAADVASMKAAPAAPPPDWFDTLTIDGFLDGGIVVTPASPYNGLNWGHLFTDRANTPIFNQALFTVQRPLDPKATGIDYGFKFQTFVGEDARYSHYLGQFDYLMHDRTQFTILEAHGLVHLPILTEGGVDVKFGQFVTYNGFEVIPAKDNLFYTHSYNFNFGPFKHTGVMTVTHATEWLDIYAGVTSGLNTSLGWAGDNNNSASAYGGFGLNLLDGELTILGFSHSGPENPRQLDPNYVGWPWGTVGGIPAQCACNPNNTWRYYNNLTTTWKPTENLMFVTDISYMREDGWNPVTNAAGVSRPQGADAYGVSQNVSYKVNDAIKINGRLEYFRDNKNFFVVGYPGYFDTVNVAHGYPNQSIAQPAGQGTSYLALTLGATIAPEFPKMPFINGIIFRPEVRWDTTLNGAAPFFGWNGNKRTQGMIAMDVIVPFTIR